MTFTEFQATRTKGDNGFVYANIAPIKRLDDWIDGGDLYEIESRTERERTFKSLYAAEHALFQIWQPILEGIAERRSRREANG